MRMPTLSGSVTFGEGSLEHAESISVRKQVRQSKRVLPGSVMMRCLDSAFGKYVPIINISRIFFSISAIILIIPV